MKRIIYKYIYIFIYIIYNIYLLKSQIYIEYDTNLYFNSGYKWTPQEVIDVYML